jgi:serine/threonine protein kinase
MYDSDRFKSELEKELDNRLYKLLDKKDLGSDWSEFYLAYSRNDETLRLVKVITEPLNDINREIFESEARKLKRFENEYIVKAFEAGVLEIENQSYFFLILEKLDGDSFDKIPEHVFRDNNSFNERKKLFFEILSAIKVFRDKYFFHNDLHLGNIVFTQKNIKIIDFLPSREAYSEAKPDSDLYMIRNEIIPYFFTSEEIEEFLVSSYSELSFRELYDYVEEQLENEESEMDPRLQTQIECYEALSEIVDFYFDNFDKEKDEPKKTIEKEKRTELMTEIALLYDNRHIANQIGINVSGTWDATMHRRGINHEIYIIVDGGLLIKIIQHEYGEVMSLRLTLDGELVKDPKTIKEVLDNIRRNAQNFTKIQSKINSYRGYSDLIQEIDKEFKSMLDREKIEGDLEFHFVVFPTNLSNNELFGKQDYKKLRKTLRSIDYGPNFIIHEFNQILHDLKFLRIGLFSVRKSEYPSGNLFISREGIIIYHYCYRMRYDSPKNHYRLNHYYISGIFIALIEFLGSFYQEIGNGKIDSIQLRLNIDGIENWKFSPISMNLYVDEEAFYYFKPSKFREYSQSIRLSQLKTDSDRLKIAQEIMSNILLDFGYERNYRIHRDILNEYH